MIAARRFGVARGEKSDLAGCVPSGWTGAVGLMSRSFPRTKSAIDSCCGAEEFALEAMGDRTADVSSSSSDEVGAGDVVPAAGVLGEDGDVLPGRLPRRSVGFLGPWPDPALVWLDDWPDEPDDPEALGSAQATVCALVPAIPTPMPTAMTDRLYRSGMRLAVFGQREPCAIIDVPLDIPRRCPHPPVTGMPAAANTCRLNIYDNV